MTNPTLELGFPRTRGKNGGRNRGVVFSKGGEFTCSRQNRLAYFPEKCGKSAEDHPRHPNYLRTCYDCTRPRKGRKNLLSTHDPNRKCNHTRCNIRKVTGDVTDRDSRTRRELADYSHRLMLSFALEPCFVHADSLID